MNLPWSHTNLLFLSLKYRVPMFFHDLTLFELREFLFTCSVYVLLVVSVAEEGTLAPPLLPYLLNEGQTRVTLTSFPPSKRWPQTDLIPSITVFRKDDNPVRKGLGGRYPYPKEPRKTESGWPSRSNVCCWRVLLHFPLVLWIRWVVVQ